jgi:hypothetical protein
MKGSLFKSKEDKEIEKQLKLFAELFDHNFKSKEEKLDELIRILEHSNFNSEQLINYKIRVEKVIHEKKIKEDIEHFDEIDQLRVETESSKLELLDNFELLLNSSELNSEDAYKYVKQSKTKSTFKIIFGVILMVLGLGMIVMPSPENFEMYTLFYFTRDDGITVMDLISGLVIVAGIFIILYTIKSHQKHY